jgi:hypothetical protein
MHILDGDTAVSLSSIFALSPKVIALPLPTFSKNFHLRLGSVVRNLKEGRTGRHIGDWGFNDSPLSYKFSSPSYRNNSRSISVALL